MKLALEDTVVKVFHKGQTIEWNAKELKRPSRENQYTRSTDPDDLPGEDDPFDQLNLYLNHLSEEKQDRLFALYQQAFDVFLNSSGEMYDLIRALTEIVKQIWLVCPIADVAYWVKSLSTIRIPPDAKVFKTMEENAKNGELYGSNNWPRESAYLEDDYWNLIYLLASLRLLYPIWAQFALHANEVVGNNVKFFYALKIITSTSIVESEGYKHLRNYLQHHLVLDQDLNRNTFNGGVSTADFVEHITSLVVVRKFSQFNYSGHNGKFNMVATFFHFVGQTVNTLTNHLHRAILPKAHEGTTFQGGEEKRPDSPFEMVKIKEELTAGDIVIMNECALDTYAVARQLCPDLPLNLLEDAINVAQTTWIDVMYEQPQITILQWVMGKETLHVDEDTGEQVWDVVFQPRGVDELERDGTLSLMAAAAATLWHRGYYDLAALMTAKRVDPKETAGLLPAENPHPLTVERIEQLVALYPHIQRSAKASRNTKKQATAAIIDDIDLLREQLRQFNWHLTLPKSWLDKGVLTRNNRRYVLRANIRNTLADLSIAIATRQF